MKKKHKNRIGLDEYAFYALLLFAVLYIAKNTVKNYLLRVDYRITKAVIINQTNGLGNNNVAREFTYSYRFCVQNDCYTNNSLDTRYKIGDTIRVKYYESFPRFNEPIKAAAAR
jgi:hypothetical protein